MMIHVFVPYPKFKAHYGVTLLKDCKRIINDEIFAVADEHSKRASAQWIWNNEGNKRIGISFYIDTDDSELDTFIALFEDISEEFQVFESAEDFHNYVLNIFA